MLREQLKQLLQEGFYAVKDLFHRLWMSIHGWHEEDGPIRRKKHRRKTAFYFGTAEGGRNMHLLRVVFSVCVVGMLIFSAVNLIDYGLDYMNAKKNAAALRELYYQDDGQEEDQPTAEPAAETIAEPTATPYSEPAADQTGTVVQASQPTAKPVTASTTKTRLEPVSYPGNPHLKVSGDFERLRRQNSDIVGWLKIDGMIDEVVVQRDNSYYLRRDYRGYHNTNGAIFMDEHCDLSTRPYIYALYGHNMKSGLMFGNLRNYENLSFYKNNPFITFDTAYEPGRYVIFATGVVSTDASDWNYLNLSWLFSTSVDYRTKGISQLKRFSVFNSGIQVLADDQLLILITCVGDEEDRRVVAARRIRDNETEQSLMQTVRVTQMY